MISTEPTARPEHDDAAAGLPSQHGSAPGRRPPDGSVMTLRGAGVDVNVRRVIPYVIGACLVALTVAIVAFTVAGIQKNDQANSLRHHGVVVEATVSGCIGLMGGSGSNLAGYACRASFTLDGHRYDESLAGNPTPVTGSKFRAVTVPGDPALLATVAAVAGEQASWRVFIVPAILLIVLALTIVALLSFRARRRTARATA
jgi:hypothetical protein